MHKSLFEMKSSDTSRLYECLVGGEPEVWDVHPSSEAKPKALWLSYTYVGALGVTMIATLRSLCASEPWFLLVHRSMVWC